MKTIELKHLSFKYKSKSIIENLSLSLSGTVCTALIGANGSGKTTLGKLMMGMLSPDKGVVEHDGLSIEGVSLSDVSNRVGYLFQNPAKQIFAVTVRDDLIFPSRMNGLSEVLIKKKFDHVVSLFHLDEIVDSKCHLLSHGEKQRVALASIFMREPDYLILDEPTTGLDMVRKEALGRIINDLKSEGIGILMISHDQAFVQSYADNVLEMGSL